MAKKKSKVTHDGDDRQRALTTTTWQINTVPAQAFPAPNLIARA
jgi:hypothetical protein